MTSPTRNTLARALGAVLGNTVNAYWYSRIPNFGDLLTPVLLRYYGLTPINTPPLSAEVVCVGSVLEHVPEDYRGYIAGSGLMHDARRTLRNASVLAVRGALTRDRICAPASTPLGDPGLLVSRIFRKRQKKKYRLGVVPHRVDKGDDRLARIADRFAEEVLVIDVQRRPQEVVADIDRCAFVLSSCLHGVVAADSLGIPNAWILLSDNVLGAGFKFRDYASALGSVIEPRRISGNEGIDELAGLTHEVSGCVGQVQNDLDKVFRLLASDIRNRRRGL